MSKKDIQFEQLFAGSRLDRRIRIARAGNPQFKYLQWLLTAVSTSVDRPVLWAMRSEGLTCAATDGRRLHTCAKFLEIPEGTWLPEVNTTNEVILVEINRQYPDFACVIPDDSEPTRHPLKTHVEWGAEGILMVRLGIAVDTNMLRDAVWGGGVRDKNEKVPLELVAEPDNPATRESERTQSGYLAGPGPLVLNFSDWSRKAVIMPFKLKGDIYRDNKA